MLYFILQIFHLTTPVVQSIKPFTSRKVDQNYGCRTPQPAFLGCPDTLDTHSGCANYRHVSVTLLCDKVTIRKRESAGNVSDTEC